MSDYPHDREKSQLNDGRILSWGKDENLRVLSATSGECITMLTGHTECVTSAVELSDGRILSCSKDNTMSIWSAESGNRLATRKWSHTGENTWILELKDNKVLSIVHNDVGTLWDTVNGSILPTIIEWMDDSDLLLKMMDGSVLPLDKDTVSHVWHSPYFQQLSKRRLAIDRAESILKLKNGNAVVWERKHYGCNLPGYPIVKNQDYSMYVLDADHGNKLKELKGHTDNIEEVLELKKDNRILSWAMDKTLRVWNTTSGRCLMEFKGHTNIVEGALELKDGRILSWAGGEIRIWDAIKGEPFTKLKAGIYADRALELKHGRVLIRDANGNLVVVDTNTGQCIWEMKGGSTRGIPALELKDTRILSWAEYNTQILNVDDGKCLVELKGYTGTVSGAVELKDGSVLSWSPDKTPLIYTWDTADGAHLAEFKGHTDYIGGALELKDGRILSWAGGEIRIWNAADGKLLAELKGHTVLGALELKNGNILSWSDDGTIRIWDPIEGKPLISVSTSYNLKMIKERAAFYAANTKELEVFYAANMPGHNKDDYELMQEPHWVLELDDGGILTLISDYLYIWHAPNGTCLMKLGVPYEDGDMSGALKLYNQKILSWSGNTLRIWNASNGELLAELKGHTGYIYGALELKDGRVLSWADDDTIRIWNLSSNISDTIWYGDYPLQTIINKSLDSPFLCLLNSKELIKINLIPES